LASEKLDAATHECASGCSYGAELDFKSFVFYSSRTRVNCKDARTLIRCAGPLPARALLFMDARETKRFGRYLIVDQLGRGAMGVVYKARDPQIDRVVALKTVSLMGLEPEEQEEFLTRFRCEAQAAGRLHHPGIVTVFDVGEDEESHEPYIVLEYVAGESLSRILSREKKLPLPKALLWAEELADALDYAHAQGVVHRDIKPANILIGEDGHAKIADFGIAKLNMAHFTLPGRVLGTPAYMAPEQLAGEGVDNRSDLFSLGVILYSMVTGHSPFTGNSATTVCFKVVNREPMPASSLDLELPRALDGVITRAMAKDPTERFQRGAEFADALRELRGEHDPSSTTTSPWNLPTYVRRTNTRQLAEVPIKNVAGIVQVQRLVQTTIAKARIRNLIFAAAAVIALIIVAIPSRRAITSQKATGAVPLLATSNRPRDGVTSAGSQSNSQALESTSANSAAMGSETAKSKDGGNASSAAVRKIDNKRKSASPSRPLKKSAQVAATHSVPSEDPSPPPVVAQSTIEVAVQHQFKEATLWVSVDDNLALTLPLHGGTQKRLVVFKSVQGTEAESLQVPAGTHTLRIRAQTADQSIDLSKTISGTFAAGDDKTLHITFDKHNTDMHLVW
jgi:serine/threonine-protein kinase